MENDFEYVSLYIDLDDKHVIDFEGYYEKPFTVHREGLKAGEKYGRSPSFDAIGLISQTNKVVQNLMQIVNRAGCPPLGSYEDFSNFNRGAGAFNVFERSGGGNNPPVFNIYQETGEMATVNAYLQDLYEQISQFYSTVLLVL
jgi:hypothetical protein